MTQKTFREMETVPKLQWPETLGTQLSKAPKSPYSVAPAVSRPGKMKAVFNFTNLVPLIPCKQVSH